VVAEAGAVLSPFVVEGNLNSFGPFVIDVTSSLRYQQVYGASDFTRFFSTPGLISGMAFRPDGNDSFSGGIVQDVQIDLSTTSKAPDDLSPVFAENVGNDDIVVVNRGRLLLPGPSPHQGFAITIPFAHPFLYDPAAGNLLLDVRVYSGFILPGPVFPKPMDAERTLGDTVSEVTGYVDAPMATGAATMGLVTLFTFEPIPEPNSVALMLLSGGVLAISWAVRRPRAGGGVAAHRTPPRD